jgi:hypothetical protein
VVKRQCGELFDPLNRDVAALGPAEISQLLHEGGDPIALRRGRTCGQVSDGWQFRWLLRAPRAATWQPQRRARI